MNQFDFIVCQLEIGAASNPSPASQSIAQSIVEQHILKGYTITDGLTHLANAPEEVEQDPVDLLE